MSPKPGRNPTTGAAIVEAAAVEVHLVVVEVGDTAAEGPLLWSRSLW